MNDLERDLRDLFEQKASEAGAAPAPPERIVRRARRRQIGTVALAAVTAIALIGGTLGVISSIDRGVTGHVPANDPYASGRYPIFDRTATIENFTITSPSNWYLVNQWALTQRLTQRSGQTTCSGSAEATLTGSEPAEVSDGGVTETCTTSPSLEGALESIPIFRLSNRDPGLDLPICNFGGTEPAVAGDVATFQVSVDYQALGRPGGGIPSEWPVELDESTPVSDGACGKGRYARFMVDGIPYVAWIGFGPETSDEDRAQAFDSLSSMAIDGRPQDPQTENAAYVIAGGTNAAGPWTLELIPSRTSGPSSNVELNALSPRRFVVEGTAGAGDFTVPAVPIEQAGGDPTFGAVTKEAAGVVLQPQDGSSVVPATLVPLPPSMPFDFDLFFAPYEPDVPATAVAIGLPEPASEQPESSTSASRSDDAVKIESNDGDHWTLSLSGSEQEACFDFDTRGDNFEPFCAGPLSANEPIVRIFSDSGALYAVGSAPAPLADVWLDGPGAQTSQGECVQGPSGWNGAVGCVLPLLNLEDGTIVFFGPEISGGEGETSLSWPMDRSRQLPWITQGDDSVVATGPSDSWRVEQLPDGNGLTVDIGGRIQGFEEPAFEEPIVLGYPDRPYDALLLVLTDTSVDQIDVASEGRWYGRWLPSTTKDGDEARLWVVELPGMGGGGLSYDGGRSVPISWP